MKEKQTEVYKITRSYSENFMHDGVEGGKRFEKSDLFSSHSYSFYSEPSAEEIKLKSNELFQKSVADVKDAIYQLKGLMRVKSQKGEEAKDEGLLIHALETQGDGDMDRADLLTNKPEIVAEEINKIEE